MNWIKLGENCYEGENNFFYFHLRKEEGVWVLDIFKNNKPFEYVETFDYSSFFEAKEEAGNYLPYIK